MTKLPHHIFIAGRRVGPGEPCYVVAEAGSNHNGDLPTAMKLVDAAASAGCDAVKFQVFQPGQLMTATGPRAAYLDDLMDDDQTLFDLFRQTAIDRDWLPILAGRCRDRAIHFLATPFDVDAVAALTAPDVAMPAVKNASSELWHFPLIRAEAATGLPLIMSTGMADLTDVADAVTEAVEAGCRELCLLHCTVTYPAPSEAINLAAMDSLNAAFGVPVGLSDHTLGTWAPIAAVARGATVIEKHFTLDRATPGPDHAFALEPDELREMVSGIRDTELAIGDGQKRRQASEEEIYSIGRRNLVYTRAKAAGDVIRDDDITVLRSPLGVAPKHAPEVIGRTLASDVDDGASVQWSDFV